MMMRNRAPSNAQQLDDDRVPVAGAAHRARMIDDLAQVYRGAPAPSRLDTSMMDAIAARARESGRPARRPLWTWRPGRRPGVRVAAIVAAVLLALSGGSGYLRLSSPPAASAQAVLHQAAASMALAPNQAAHFVYAVSVSTADSSAKAALSGAADVWVQTDAGGAPTLLAESLSMDKAGMSSRYVQAGGHLYAYNPEMRGDNTILLNAGARGMASWVVPVDVFDGATVAQQISALAQHSPQSVSLLPQQTLDGRTVDALQVNGWTNRPAQRTVFYFDAQTYVLRGFDATSDDPAYPMPSWQARLSSSSVMPAAQAPANTFALDAPASAQVQVPDLGDPIMATAFDAAFTATCRAQLTIKSIAAAGQSPLAVCQVTAPDVTSTALVDALAASDTAALNAAVTQGVMAEGQAATALSAERAWLSSWVTTPLNQRANPSDTPGPTLK